MKVKKKTRVICGIIFLVVIVTALFGKNKLFNGKLTCMGAITDYIVELKNDTTPAFDTDNISKIWFEFGPSEEVEVPSEDLEEIIDWLETFKIGDRVKRGKVQPAGTNSVSVRIEYSDGTIIENGLSTIRLGKKEYHLIYANVPKEYLRLSDSIGR